MAAARYVPIVLLGVFAGVLVDRAPRRWVLIGCDVARGLALGMVVALALAHHAASLWLLVGVVLVLGIGQLGFQVAYWAWLPEVTGEATLGQTTAALEASDAASTLAGPALGGVLIQTIGPALALGADALSYAVSAGALVAIRDPVPPKRPSRPLTWRVGWREVGEGLEAILTNPERRLLISLNTTLSLSSASIGVLLAVLTQNRLHLPAWQAGFVYGAAGIGGLVGSVLLAPILLRWPWRRAQGVAYAGSALGMLGLAGATLLRAGAGFALAFTANLVLDGSAALGFIIAGTTSMLITPPELRGRLNATSALYSACIRGLGLLATGALAATGNPLPAFLLLGGLFLVAAGVAGYGPSKAS